MARYAGSVCLCERMSPALADDLGDQVYIVKLHEKKEIDAFFRFATE